MLVLSSVTRFQRPFPFGCPSAESVAIVVPSVADGLAVTCRTVLCVRDTLDAPYDSGVIQVCRSGASGTHGKPLATRLASPPLVGTHKHTGQGGPPYLCQV